MAEQGKAKKALWVSAMLLLLAAFLFLLFRPLSPGKQLQLPEERIEVEELRETLDPQSGEPIQIPGYSDKSLVVASSDPRQGSIKATVQAPVTNSPDLAVQDEMRETLDQALAGGVEQAVEVARQLKNCNSGFDTPEKVESVLENWKNQVDFTRPLSFSSGGLIIKANSFAELSEIMRTQLVQCVALREVATEPVHERLTRLAQEGDQLARYLYAMWPPAQNLIGEVQWVDWLEYQDQALKFTWDNIAEGEPLGLLALAQSYTSGMVPYFTPSNSSLGELLFLTAFKCGVSVPYLDSKVGEIIDRRDQLEQFRPGGLDQLNTASEEMVQVFCPAR